MSVIATGPVFDGRATLALERYKNNLKSKLGEIGKARIRLHLAGVLRHPTGRYDAKIHTEGGGAAGDLQITDAYIVYGPWLEGVGSRNSPVTRFPGYHTFRIVYQDLDMDSHRIANDYLNLGGYLREMN